MSVPTNGVPSSEPAASSVSPLLGTNFAQSAADRLGKVLSKSADGLEAFTNRIRQFGSGLQGGPSRGGVGNPSTLGGGKPNGGGATIGGAPMLSAGKGNGGHGNGTFIGMPGHQSPGGGYADTIWRMQNGSAGPGQSGGNGNGGSGWWWGRYGRYAGAAYGAYAVNKALGGTKEMVTTNTTAQMMARSSNMSWSAIRSLTTRDNFTATSSTDAMGMGSTLMRSGYAIGSSGYNSMLGLAKNYRIMDPTATASEASARLTSFANVGTSNFLLTRGVRTRQGGQLRDPNAIADDILSQAGYSKNFKWDQATYAQQWGAGGNAERLISQLAKVDPEQAKMVQDRLQARQQASMHGLSVDQFDRAVRTNDWGTLEKAGYNKTDLDRLRDVDAKKRNIEDNRASGFSKGLEHATTALEKFYGVLDQITKGWVGGALGYGGGVAGASGLVQSALNIGGGIAGGMIGQTIGGRLSGAGGLGGMVGQAKGRVLGTPVVGPAVGRAARSGPGKWLRRNFTKGGGALGVVGGIAGDMIGNAIQDGNGGARDVVGGAISGAASGAMMGAWFGPWGALAGGLIGGAVGGVTSYLNTGDGQSSGDTFVKPVNAAPSFPWGRYPSGGVHRALDLAVPVGTRVGSPLSGTVKVAGWDNTGFGNSVRIANDNGTYTILGHMSALSVKPGDKVNAGSAVGLSGNTGRSTGPHVHVELRHEMYNPKSAFNFTSWFNSGQAAGTSVGKADPIGSGKSQTSVPGGGVGGATPEQILSVARRYIGVPYKYGGGDPTGFDCSGLVHYVFRSCGVSLPRRTADQMRQGSEVRIAEAKAGDLVFVPGKHVAIYAGGGRIIEAPKTGGTVQETALRPEFTTARRVLNDKGGKAVGSPKNDVSNGLPGGPGNIWDKSQLDLLTEGLSFGTTGAHTGSEPSKGGMSDAGNGGSAGATGGGAVSGLRGILQKAGFSGKSLDMAYAIAMAESSGNANAHNGNRATGDNSYGLFQINMLGAMGPERLKQYGLSSNNDLFDPATNAKVAYAMSKGGTDWSPWSTYKRGDYKQYLGGQMKSYDVGSTNIDVDQTARVHKGEMIIDPVTADQMRKALSSNTPTSIFGSGKKSGGGVHVDKIVLQTSHPFVDSAATDLANQFLSIVDSRQELESIRSGR